MAACFALWIGAAGLICWALVPQQAAEDPGISVNSVPVVKTAKVTAATPLQLSMAQR